MSVEWMISGHENDAATVLAEGNDQNRGTNAGIINAKINITVDVLALFPVLFMLARTPTLALSAKAPLCQLGCYFPILNPTVWFLSQHIWRNKDFPTASEMPFETRAATTTTHGSL